MAGPTTTDTHRRHMRHALALARRGLGRVAPNPAVGCVIVHEGHVVGRGWTRPGGRPHAETEALRQAGDRARGATAYVTLEPCSHIGKTPPCAEALIAAGIGRVIVALGDPDPRVDGAGLKRLEQARVEVIAGVERDAAEALNTGFLTHRIQSRPAVTLKLATSLDGHIATASGESQWITGAAARRYGHMLRAQHDAILVGSGTVRADDPDLTCRLEGLEDRSPVRVVLDSRLSLPLTARLVQTASQIPVIICCGPDADSERKAALLDAGVQVLDIATDGAGIPEVQKVLAALAEVGLTRLLIEGGARVAAAFLRADLVDEIALFRAPLVIGGDGLPAIGGFGQSALAEAPRFRHAATRPLGDDSLETYVRNA